MQDVPLFPSPDDATRFIVAQRQRGWVGEAARRVPGWLHTAATVLVLPLALVQSVFAMVPLQFLLRVVQPDPWGLLIGVAHGIFVSLFLLLPVSEAQTGSSGGMLCALYSALLSLLVGQLAVVAVDLVAQRTAWTPAEWLRDWTELQPERCCTLQQPTDAQLLGILLGLSQAYPLLQQVDLQPANRMAPPAFSEWCRPLSNVHPLAWCMGWSVAGALIRMSSIPRMRIGAVYNPRSHRVYDHVNDASSGDDDDDIKLP